MPPPEPNTSSSSPGLLNACAVADATPLWNSTNQQTTRKPARTGHISHGRNRNVNGAVSRLVISGLVTRTFQRSASSGFRFGGALCSVPASRPWSASFSASRTTCCSSSPRPRRSDIASGQLVVVAPAVEPPRAAHTSAVRDGPSARRRDGPERRPPCTRTRGRVRAARPPRPGAGELWSAPQPPERGRGFGYCGHGRRALARSGAIAD